MDLPLNREILSGKKKFCNVGNSNKFMSKSYQLYRVNQKDKASDIYVGYSSLACYAKIREKKKRKHV